MHSYVLYSFQSKFPRIMLISLIAYDKDLTKNVYYIARCNNLITQGSITGAYSPTQENVVPSFILLAVQGPNVVCYVYELINGEVEVSKTEFSKDGGIQ